MGTTSNYNDMMSELRKLAEEAGLEIDTNTNKICGISAGSVSEIMARIMFSYSADNISKVAVLMGCSSGCLYNALKRDFLPEKYILQCAIDTKANPFWLITGDDKYSHFFDELQH